MSSYISTIIFGAPMYSITDIYDSDDESTAFKDFISTRSRAYVTSSEDVETPVTGRHAFGCNCYSSGEDTYSERVMVEAWPSMLRWLSLVHSMNGYTETEMVIRDRDNRPEAIEWNE